MVRYAITDRMLLGGDETARERALIEQAARLARDGVDYMQLREKDLSAGKLVELARAMMAEIKRNAGSGQKRVGQQARTRLLINSRADVALAADADGVHLTSAAGELRPAEVRRLFREVRGREAVVSVSCHTVDEVRSVVAREADDRPGLILFGPVFEKVVMGGAGSELCSAGAGIGLERLREACLAAGAVPALALGGVTAASAAECVRAGAAGYAGIREFRRS